MKKTFKFSSNEQNTALGCLLLLGLLILVFGACFGVLCLEGWAVMVLVNYALVPWLGISELSYWGAFCIVLLCNILFGGLRASVSSKD